MTLTQAPALDGLAALLAYPRGHDLARIEQCAEAVAALVKDAVAPLQSFADAVAGMSEGALQEAYTGAFDFTEECSLCVGWHLFADRPERADLMVRLREELDRAGIPEGPELPDHLSHVLLLLAREEPRQASDLASLVAPAVEAVRAALERRGNVYGDLLAAVEAVINGLRAKGEEPAS